MQVFSRQPKPPPIPKKRLTSLHLTETNVTLEERNLCAVILQADDVNKSYVEEVTEEQGSEICYKSSVESLCTGATKVELEASDRDGSRRQRYPSIKSNIVPKVSAIKTTVVEKATDAESKAFKGKKTHRRVASVDGYCNGRDVIFVEQIYGGNDEFCTSQKRFNDCVVEDVNSEKRQRHYSADDLLDTKAATVGKHITLPVIQKRKSKNPDRGKKGVNFNDVPTVKIRSRENSDEQYYENENVEPPEVPERPSKRSINIMNDVPPPELPARSSSKRNKNYDHKKRYEPRNAKIKNADDGRFAQSVKDELTANDHRAHGESDDAVKMNHRRARGGSDDAVKMNHHRAHGESDDAVKMNHRRDRGESDDAVKTNHRRDRGESDDAVKMNHRRDRGESEDEVNATRSSDLDYESLPPPPPLCTCGADRAAQRKKATPGGAVRSRSHNTKNSVTLKNEKNDPSTKSSSTVDEGQAQSLETVVDNNKEFLTDAKDAGENFSAKKSYAKGPREKQKTEKKSKIKQAESLLTGLKRKISYVSGDKLAKLINIDEKNIDSNLVENLVGYEQSNLKYREKVISNLNIFQDLALNVNNKRTENGELLLSTLDSSLELSDVQKFPVDSVDIGKEEKTAALIEQHRNTQDTATDSQPAGTSRVTAGNTKNSLFDNKEVHGENNLPLEQYDNAPPLGADSLRSSSIRERQDVDLLIGHTSSSSLLDLCYIQDKNQQVEYTLVRRHLCCGSYAGPDEPELGIRRAAAVTGTESGFGERKTLAKPPSCVSQPTSIISNIGFDSSAFSSLSGHNIDIPLSLSNFNDTIRTVTSSGDVFMSAGIKSGEFARPIVSREPQAAVAEPSELASEDTIDSSPMEDPDISLPAAEPFADAISPPASVINADNCNQQPPFKTISDIALSEISRMGKIDQLAKNAEVSLDSVARTESSSLPTIMKLTVISSPVKSKIVKNATQVVPVELVSNISTLTSNDMPMNNLEMQSSNNEVPLLDLPMHHLNQNISLNSELHELADEVFESPTMTVSVAASKMDSEEDVHYSVPYASKHSDASKMTLVRNNVVSMHAVSYDNFRIVQPDVSYPNSTIPYMNGKAKNMVTTSSLSQDMEPALNFNLTTRLEENQDNKLNKIKTANHLRRPVDNGNKFAPFYLSNPEISTNRQIKNSPANAARNCLIVDEDSTSEERDLAVSWHDEIAVSNVWNYYDEKRHLENTNSSVEQPILHSFENIGSVHHSDPLLAATKKERINYSGALFPYNLVVDNPVYSAIGISTHNTPEKASHNTIPVNKNLERVKNYRNYNKSQSELNYEQSIESNSFMFNRSSRYNSSKFGAVHIQDDFRKKMDQVLTQNIYLQQPANYESLWPIQNKFVHQPAVGMLSGARNESAQLPPVGVVRPDEKYSAVLADQLRLLLQEEGRQLQQLQEGKQLQEMYQEQRRTSVKNYTNQKDLYNCDVEPDVQKKIEALERSILIKEEQLVQFAEMQRRIGEQSCPLHGCFSNVDGQRQSQSLGEIVLSSPFFDSIKKAQSEPYLLSAVQSTEVPYRNDPGNEELLQDANNSQYQDTEGHFCNDSGDGELLQDVNKSQYQNVFNTDRRFSAHSFVDVPLNPMCEVHHGRTSSTSQSSRRSISSSKAASTSSRSYPISLYYQLQRVRDELYKAEEAIEQKLAKVYLCDSLMSLSDLKEHNSPPPSHIISDDLQRLKDRLAKTEQSFVHNLSQHKRTPKVENYGQVQNEAVIEQLDKNFERHHQYYDQSVTEKNEEGKEHQYLTNIDHNEDKKDSTLINHTYENCKANFKEDFDDNYQMLGDMNSDYFLDQMASNPNQCYGSSDEEANSDYFHEGSQVQLAEEQNDSEAGSKINHTNVYHELQLLTAQLRDTERTIARKLDRLTSKEQKPLPKPKIVHEPRPPTPQKVLSPASKSSVGSSPEEGNDSSLGFANITKYWEKRKV